MSFFDPPIFFPSRPINGHPANSRNLRSGGLLVLLVLLFPSASVQSQEPSFPTEAVRSFYYENPHFFAHAIASANPAEVESYFDAYPQARLLARDGIHQPLRKLAEQALEALTTRSAADQQLIKGEQVTPPELPPFASFEANLPDLTRTRLAVAGLEEAINNLSTAYTAARESLQKAMPDPLPDTDEARLEAGKAYREASSAGFRLLRLAGYSFFREIAVPEGLTWDDGSDLPEFANPNAPRGGTERIVISDFPRTLRTVGPDANGAFRNYLLDDNQMRLARQHPNVPGRYIPGLARSWTPDPDDGSRAFFQLDPAARWSDGHPVDADDFLFSGYFFQSPYIIAPWYNDWMGNLITGITKYDDHTIAVTYAAAKPDLIYRTADWSPRPEHFYAEFGPDYVERYQWEFEPTTGPWVVRPEDIQKGRSIRIQRLEDWWARDKPFYRGRFNTETLQFVVIRDTAKALEAFRKGELDIAGLNTPDFWHEKISNEIEEVSKGYIQKATFHNLTPVPSFAIRINSAQPLLEKPSMRLGISHAMNYDKVLEVVYRGEYERMRTCADGYGATTHPTLEPWPYDVAKARAYFAELGFDRFNDDGFLVRTIPGGHGWIYYLQILLAVLFGIGAFLLARHRKQHLAVVLGVLAAVLALRVVTTDSSRTQVLEFTLSTGYSTLRPEFLVLQQYAAKAGLKLNIEILDGTVAWKKLQEKRHELTYFAFNVSPEDYPRFWEPYHSDNAYKPSAFLPDGSINPERQIKTQTNNVTMTAWWELDQLINRYRASSDMDEITSLSHRMQEMIHEDGCWIPAWKRPWFRLGYWRWVGWPKGFNVMKARSPAEWNLHWIDTAKQQETLEAQRSGRAFEPQILVFDQFKEN